MTSNPAARARALMAMATLVLALMAATASAADKPNILVIWGDDIGFWNLSTNNMGMMGYETPNIDRIAQEGAKFTDYYGQQSCTAGRSAFITGQSPIRTGLTKVGIPGADLGIRPEDVTLATLLKEEGYTTGQFGKNHLGDRDEFLPTQHGFDEFFGNLYHLNAEEEPEHPDYPKDPRFRERFGPRGVIHSYADGRIEDTGALTKKRMETVDREFLASAKSFIARAVERDQPFFVWFNSTRMHYYTHTADDELGLSGQGFYNDAMVGHDMLVGELLDQLDELGIADDTIVLYSTDNGPHFNMWPDAGITPFRSEKNTNWEGGYRVPAMVRWPGKIPPNQVINDIMSHTDWVPTLMAAVGRPDITESLKAGTTAHGRQYRNHLDGYNFLPRLTGEAEQGPRRSFFYWSDDGLLTGIRVGDWKLVYAEQRAQGFDVWREQFDVLRIPKIFHLRRDPFERADQNANTYDDWWNRVTLARAAMARVELGRFLATLKAFPPRQRPATFTIDQMMEGLYNRE
jgi:arylsulfatase A-like enzyme